MRPSVFIIFSKASLLNWLARSKSLLFFVFLAGSLLNPFAVFSQDLLVKQEQIKAVYLYNFLHFVFLPEPSVGQQITIGVVGESPVRAALEELQKSLEGTGKTAFVIKHYERYSAATKFAAHRILFVSASEEEHFESITASLAGQPVLTVAESESFLEKGGMIALREVAGKVRYQINGKATKKAGLRLHSQLLKSSLK